MKPYSLDLRQRVFDAVQRGEGSLRELADFFQVHLSFIVRLLRRHRDTGSLAPKPHAGGPQPLLDDHALQELLRLVREQPDATLAELRDRLGVPCSIMTIARALKRHRLSRKKKTRHAQQRDTPEAQAQRQAFQQRMAEVEPEHLVFVDEMGATTDMTRTHGRAPAGERVHGAVPGKWESVTLIAGLRLAGVTAPFVFEGATDTEAFRVYAQRVLTPEVGPGDVVVWDNLQPHKDAVAIRAVESAGAVVVPAPPWSPDLIPIEEMFAKVKECLRSLAARTTEAIGAALGAALAQVSTQDILGWFQDRAAYAMHS
jgi:transposase